MYFQIGLQSGMKFAYLFLEVKYIIISTVIL